MSPGNDERRPRQGGESSSSSPLNVTHRADLIHNRRSRRIALAAASLHRWGRAAIGEHPGRIYQDSSHEFIVEVLVELFTLAVGPCTVEPVEAAA